MEDEKKSRRMPGHREMMIWNVPEDLKDQFKAKCILEKTTMRDEIIRMIGDYVKAD